MGQGVGGVSEAPAVGPRESREPIGRYLAQQRRLRGIELGDLAERTRIPRRSLERLEAGAFDHSPDGFSRGFVRTVAEAIGLDPDDAVARMLPEPEAAPHGGTRWARVVAALGVLAAVVLGALFTADRLLAPPAPISDAQGRSLPVRRDYVRALAAAHGIEASARDAVIAFRPAPPPTEALPAEVASEAALEVAREPSPPLVQAAPAVAAAQPKPAPNPRAEVAIDTAPAAPPASPTAATAPSEGVPVSPPPEPAPAETAAVPAAEQDSTAQETTADDAAAADAEPLPSAAPEPSVDAEAHD